MHEWLSSKLGYGTDRVGVRVSVRVRVRVGSKVGVGVRVGLRLRSVKWVRLRDMYTSA